jgi:NAD(P)-dependent dehydrogenase (short-subunit alcohol dehydrogenase family)
VNLLDSVMDALVVPGYTSLGYTVRSRDWERLPRMDGRTVLVTGATSGIGRAAAEGFARLGARVIVLARSEERGLRAVGEIVHATGNEDVELVIGDLADLGSLRDAAATITDPLDVLVHNAGVLPPERSLSADGIELTLATNVVGPFALTALLTERLAAASPARIVTVSSGGMYAQALDLDDLQLATGTYRGNVAYARTKRAQVVLTQEWTRRLAGRGITAHAMHPGWVDTPGIEDSLPHFHRLLRPVLRTPEQGADTVVWLGAAAEPLGTPGRFWHDRRVRPTERLPRTATSPRDAERLWEACERLAGQGWHDVARSPR